MKLSDYVLEKICFPRYSKPSIFLKRSKDRSSPKNFAIPSDSKLSSDNYLDIHRHRTRLEWDGI